MTVTAESAAAVIININDNHPQWPRSQQTDEDPAPAWMLAWDAAVFARYWFQHEQHDNLDEAICHYKIHPADFEYTITEYHGRTKSPSSMIKTHLLRLSKGWSGETAVVNYLNNTDNQHLLSVFEFNDGVPSQGTLWKAWNKRLVDPDNPHEESVHQRTLRVIANSFVQNARQHGVPAPARAFQPDPTRKKYANPDPKYRTIKDYIETKTEDVWAEVAPIICNNYELKRGSNTSIDEDSWWEAHAHLAPRKDTYPESGVDNFRVDTDRTLVQSGGWHRRKLQEIDIDEARENHRAVVKELLRRAIRNDQLNDELWLAIDNTKGPELTNRKNLEGWHPDPKKRNVTEKWILGYDHSDKGEKPDIKYHFQYGQVQIIGKQNPPIPLDSVPISRGMSREEITDELLSGAVPLLEEVGLDAELVVMDKEFGLSAVHKACERHGVPSLAFDRANHSEQATFARLRMRGDRSLMTVDTSNEDNEWGGDGDKPPPRKRVYLPKNTRSESEWYDLLERTQREVAANTDDVREIQVAIEKSPDDGAVRQEMVENWEQITGHQLNKDGSVRRERLFDDLIQDYAKVANKKELKMHKNDTKLYSVFTSNHPDLTRTDEHGNRLSESDFLRHVGTFEEKYGYRWTIENAFKDLSKFRARTKSTQHQYRFFNHIFGNSLYAVWRMVDLLVKLTFDEDPDYAPLVPSGLFLTFAKDIFGLPPPDR